MVTFQTQLPQAARYVALLPRAMELEHERIECGRAQAPFPKLAEAGGAGFEGCPSARGGGVAREACGVRFRGE